MLGTHTQAGDGLLGSLHGLMLSPVDGKREKGGESSGPTEKGICTEVFGQAFVPMSRCRGDLVLTCPG